MGKCLLHTTSSSNKNNLIYCGQATSIDVTEICRENAIDPFSLTVENFFLKYNVNDNNWRNNGPGEAWKIQYADSYAWFQMSYTAPIITTKIGGGAQLIPQGWNSKEFSPRIYLIKDI